MIEPEYCQECGKPHAPFEKCDCLIRDKSVNDLQEALKNKIEEIKSIEKLETDQLTAERDALSARVKELEDKIKNISEEGYIVCQECNGMGEHFCINPDAPPIECGFCEGKGGFQFEKIKDMISSTGEYIRNSLIDEIESAMNDPIENGGALGLSGNDLINYIKDMKYFDMEDELGKVELEKYHSRVAELEEQLKTAKREMKERCIEYIKNKEFNHGLSYDEESGFYQGVEACINEIRALEE